jgi:hypothetical protein
MSSDVGLGELIVGPCIGFASKPWASAIEQLKGLLQEETRSSYEHLTLMLSKIRDDQDYQRSQSPDPIEEQSLDCGPSAVGSRAPRSSLSTLQK